MTAATTSISERHKPRNLRRFEARHHLIPVADLIEHCFADTLDADGRQFINQMRSAAQSARMLGRAGDVISQVNVSFTGYVWEQDGQVVGNLSLIPVTDQGKRAYLIANVAVLPAFRRRGISLALTKAALQHARKRGVQTIWLQTRADNPAALKLYTNMGFTEQARRTTWHSPRTKAAHLAVHPANIKVNLRQDDDWDQQHTWLTSLYPPSVTWHIPLDLGLLRPGIWGGLRRLFSERSIRQWSAHLGGELIGVLSWQSSISQADQLWLATSVEHEELAIQSLLPYAQGALPSRRILALNYPAGRATEAFITTGFHPHQTLVWMRAQL